jgi:hypothetical protein
MERQMDGMGNAWEGDPTATWPVLAQTDGDGETLGAQGGVGNTAVECTAAVVVGEVTADLPPRKIRKPRTRKRGGAAEPPTDADADNQGLPGSFMATDDVEAGQGLQAAADAFKEDPRVALLEQQYQRQLAALERDVALRDAAAERQSIYLKHLEGDHAVCKDDLRKTKGALKTETGYNSQMMRDIHDEKKSFQEYRDQHDETIKAAPAIATALAEAKKCLADMASELQDATNATIRVNAEKDALALEVTDLRAANERLESEATTSKDLVAASAAINTRLDEEISNIHSEFEDAFSDMAKDLTMDEKFAYARDLQQQQATLAARLAVESTLYDELEETPEPAEVLSFSKITSVETPPVPAVVAKKPLGFSMISSVNTVPVAVPAALPAAAAKKSMSFSGITSVQTVPVAAPVAAPPTAETEKPKVITKIIEVHTPYDRFVDRAVVLWWMWSLLGLGLLSCFGGFAGLLREQQIWVTANETAYQRLMGVSQETWFEWIIMGVKDLMPPT